MRGVPRIGGDLLVAVQVRGTLGQRLVASVELQLLQVLHGAQLLPHLVGVALGGRLRGATEHVSSKVSCGRHSCELQALLSM